MNYYFKFTFLLLVIPIIINNVQVESAKLNQESGEINLLLDDGQTVTTDHVVVVVGIEPETNLAKESGLAIRTLCEASWAFLRCRLVI